MSVWVQTADAEKRRNYPQRIPITHAERVDAGAEKPDALPYDKMNEFLGGPFKALNRR